MPSIFDQDVRDSLLSRLDRLSSDTKPLWGKMTAEEMLCHCADGFRMASGERPVEDKGNIFTRTVIKFAILNFSRMPKNVPTSPELDAAKLGTRSQGFETSMADLKTEMLKAEAKPDTDDWGSHAIFGKMTKHEWGKLGYKHLDHHLRQFGL